MKLVLPLQHGRVASGLGFCDAFAVYRVDPAQGTFKASCVHARPQDMLCRSLPDWAYDLGAQTLLAPRVHHTLQRRLAELHITLQHAPEGDSPDLAVMRFLAMEADQTPAPCQCNPDAKYVLLTA